MSYISRHLFVGATGSVASGKSWLLICLLACFSLLFGGCNLHADLDSVQYAGEDSAAELDIDGGVDSGVDSSGDSLDEDGPDSAGEGAGSDADVDATEALRDECDILNDGGCQ